MPIQPLSAAGLAVLGLLAACAPTAAPTDAAPPARGDAAAGETCTDTVLDRATPSVALPGPIPVWTITNSGPATVILRTPGDPALAAPFPPKSDGRPALFVGDDRYEYRLDLAPSGTSAKLRICR
jgi:hypothetical protein